MNDFYTTDNEAKTHENTANHSTESMKKLVDGLNQIKTDDDPVISSLEIVPDLVEKTINSIEIPNTIEREKDSNSDLLIDEIDKTRQKMDIRKEEYKSEKKDNAIQEKIQIDNPDKSVIDLSLIHI